MLVHGCCARRRARVRQVTRTDVARSRRAQGTGVASSLLNAALNEEDAHLLVFSFNKRAQRFYAKHGFERQGDRQIDSGTGLYEERWVRETGRPSR